MVKMIKIIYAFIYLNNNFEKFIFYKISRRACISKFVGEFFQLISQDIKFDVVSTATNFEILAVPCHIQKNGWVYGHNFMREGLSPLRAIRAPGPKRIYVSRAGLNPKDGGLLLETMIEQALELEDYTIV